MSTQSPTIPLLRRLGARVRLRLVGVVQAEAPARKRSPARNARVVVGWFVAFAVLLHLATVFAMDVAWPKLRDPEYGRRAESLRERIKEHPDRPVVLMIGSSRTAMGVKPDAWESARPGSPRDPLVFNMAMVGSGPVMELMALRRVYADGFRPSAILIEYWPPMLRQDGSHGEGARIDPRRLRLSDRSVIRDYCPNAYSIERRMWTSRWNALSENRQHLFVQVDPESFPRAVPIDAAWAKLDGWGWLPGMDPALDDDATRRRLADFCHPQYEPRFKGLTIHPNSDRAFRDIVSLARVHGTRIGFIVLPESAEFQSWYPPEVEQAARVYLAGLSRELNVPVIDTRNWMDDRYLADGFHLSRIGAEAFTARLGPAIATCFDLGREP